MLIPAGTEIEADAHGQLSIRTPGSLVVQNSGSYGVLESLTGSIRIEAGARVDAVQVRCPETCFIQGELTAWKVTAREIHLDSGARASILLQQAERIDVGSRSRLVGNFASEQELLGLFARFAPQMRPLAEGGATAADSTGRVDGAGADIAVAEILEDEPVDEA